MRTPHNQPLCGSPQNSEFERELIRERTDASRVHAQKRGVKFGRPERLSLEQKELAYRLMEEGKSVRQVATTFGVQVAFSHHDFACHADI
jgi:DNA invertase Pin-like site-specific DNA recombinase